MSELAEVWRETVRRLGGDPAAAAGDADALAARYDEPRRSYHGAAHIAAVLRGIDLLAPPMAPTDRAVLDAAACAHDVVYDGAPGEDEARSARWARASLTGAGVDERLADRVADLILATTHHRARPDDSAAAILLDADLAVLASPAGAYADYVRAVREEYGHLPEPQWRDGRARVLEALLSGGTLFQTAEGRRRWEDAARANMLSELRTLGRLPRDGIDDPET